LANHRGAEGENLRGGVRAYALDPQRAKALWARSEEMVGKAVLISRNGDACLCAVLKGIR
jgi:hypothetical protein